MNKKKGLKKAFNEFSDLLILKVILDNLDEKKKEKFIRLLEGKEQGIVDSFLKENIPDLEKKIFKQSQKEVEEMAKK